MWSCWDNSQTTAKDGNQNKQSTMSRILTCLYTIYRKYDCFIKGHMHYLLNRHCTHCIHQLHIHVNSIYTFYLHIYNIPTHRPGNQTNVHCQLLKKERKIFKVHKKHNQLSRSSNIKYITLPLVLSTYLLNEGCGHDFILF